MEVKSSIPRNCMKRAKMFYELVKNFPLKNELAKFFRCYEAHKIAAFLWLIIFHRHEAFFSLSGVTESLIYSPYFAEQSYTTWINTPSKEKSEKRSFQLGLVITDVKLNYNLGRATNSKILKQFHQNVLFKTNP